LNEIQILYDIDGKPKPLKENETFDFGRYSPSKGKTINLFIRNNSSKQADISDYHIVEQNAVWEGPDILIPDQEAPATIRILGNPDISQDDFDLDDLPKDNLHLKGKVYFTNYHSRFEN